MDIKRLHRREDSVRFIMNDLTASVHGNMMEAIFNWSGMNPEITPMLHQKNAGSCAVWK